MCMYTKRPTMALFANIHASPLTHIHVYIIALQNFLNDRWDRI